MKNLGGIVRQVRTTRGITLETLARELGMDKSNLARKERGDIGMSREEFKTATKFLGVPDVFNQWEETNRGEIMDLISNTRKDTTPKGIPIVNAAPAGRIENYETDHYDEYNTAWAYVERGEVKDPKAFAVVVVGDSMQPGLHDGDIVVCSPVLDYQEDRLVNGSVVFVRFAESMRGGCLLARLTREKGGKVRLAKDNPKYKSKIVPLNIDHIARIAVAIEKRSRHI
jgi:phage repressor protein C with HTH and peptisase S24 domain